MKLRLSSLFFRMVVFTVWAFISSAAVAASESEAQEFWMAHDEQSATEVSHQTWQDLLDKYLDDDHESGVNRFDYSAVDSADRKLLGDYLDSLQAIDPRKLSREEQLAYWVNFYNALTAQVVVKEYPVTSIRNIRFLTSPFGPWDKSLVSVQGKKLSLNDIEHAILRPIWKDPRIHFAVNCASIGCPNLASEAFTAENSDDLMDEAASDFINHSRGVEVQGDTLVLSSIFDWYGGDFGNNEAEIVAYISQYFDGDTSQLNALTKFEYQYDWSLNNP